MLTLSLAMIFYNQVIWPHNSHSCLWHPSCRVRLIGLIHSSSLNKRLIISWWKHVFKTFQGSPLLSHLFSFAFFPLYFSPKYGRGNMSTPFLTHLPAKAFKRFISGLSSPFLSLGNQKLSVQVLSQNRTRNQHPVKGLELVSIPKLLNQNTFSLETWKFQVL